MRFLLFIIPPAVLVVTGVVQVDDLNVSQRLIVACHRVDVNGVVAALRDGADVNSPFGKVNADVFQDPWTLAWPVAAKDWTPLIALANSSQYPDPPRKVENTIADFHWSQEQRKKLASSVLEQRKRESITILLILLSHKADIDADDGYGATALYDAVYRKKLEFAKTLLRFGANVNTATGTYIDGSSNITPLHRAYWSAELTKLLLESGADPKAKDSKGETPLDWARMSDDPTVARLYQAP